MNPWSLEIHIHRLLSPFEPLPGNQSRWSECLPFLARQISTLHPTSARTLRHPRAVTAFTHSVTASFRSGIYLGSRCWVLSFTWHHRQKAGGVRSGDLGSQVTEVPLAMNRSPKHFCIHLVVTEAHERETHPSAAGRCTSPASPSIQLGARCPNSPRCPTVSVRFRQNIVNERADWSGLFSRSDLLFSLRKRLLGDANTSSSDIFLSKVNYCIPGRHGFNFKTGSVTPLQQNAGFWLKVKLQFFAFPSYGNAT